MSQEKQIEEMADIIYSKINGANFDDVSDAVVALYDAGCRKQIEGEWITRHRHRGGFRTVTVVDSLGEKHTGMVDERWECDDLYCSVCGKISHDAFLNYCANCGAKMKERIEHEQERNAPGE